MVTLIAICVSDKRQEPKRPVEDAQFVKGMGIRGDSHFGFEARQVSLLRAEDIAIAEDKAGFNFPPGSLAENIVMEGLESSLPLGTDITIGEKVQLRVVEHGKRADEPHSYDYRGWCLLPDVGLFLEVVQGGSVRPGDSVHVTVPKS